MKKTMTILLTLAALLAAPVEAGRKKSRTEAAEAATALEMPAIPGPRRSVAVLKFTARSDFLIQYGLSDVGGGLTGMLTTALVESGQFVVLERANLEQVFAEQQLKGSGLVTAESGPEIGRLTGAQWVITGDVTEFSTRARGGGISLGVAGIKKLGLGLSPQKRTGIIGVDVRAIDAATGQVVASFHVRKEIKSRALAVNVAVDDISIGGNKFKQTALGQAARAAIDEVAARFAAHVAAGSWTGRVVDFAEGEIAINAGERAGVRTGDTFDIYRVGRVLTDPETGQPLGGRRRSVGRVVIDAVESELAFGRLLKTGQMVPQRGDLVVAGSQLISR